jgi:hypothetical protein
MSVVQPVEIIDKNGKRNTVHKKSAGSSTTTKRVTAVSGKAPKSKPDLDYVSFPDTEDKQTVRLIRKEFKGAVEFRFDFEINSGDLYITNRSVVMNSGDIVSDCDSQDDQLDRLDIVSDRLAEMFYSLGAFGSAKRLRVVNQESADRYVAMRLE